jgi:hypothetical protein
MEDNIDKRLLLKPGEEIDSSEEEDDVEYDEMDGGGGGGGGLPLQYMMVAKQHHSIHLQD